MAKTLELIENLGNWKNVFRNKNTGIAFVQDGSTGMQYSCHANIDATGSIRGMKSHGYWGKHDRCIKSNGLIYNIDTFICNNDFDNIAAKYCLCDSCKKRKNLT